MRAELDDARSETERERTRRLAAEAAPLHLVVSEPSDDRASSPSLLLRVAYAIVIGIAAAIKPKAKLKQGGYVAELIANGEAEIGLHQISEIIPVKGVRLVGPLPAEIQNYTTYAAAVGAQAQQAEAALALLKLLAGPAAEDVLKARGMERPPS